MFKINWKLILSFAPLVVVVFMVFASPAHAALVNCGNTDGGDINSACKLTDLFSSAAELINYMLSGAAVCAVLGVVYGGFLMVTSAGNAGRLGTGKKAVLNSMIGLAIILVAFLGVKSVFSILGFRGGNPVDDLGQLAPGQGFNIVNGTPGGGAGGPSPTGGGAVASGDAAKLAQELLNTVGTGCFYNKHVSGATPDGDTARDNIIDTAASKQAKKSSYGDSPGYVSLDPRMLQAMLAIANKGYRSTLCPVTAIAGSDHTDKSAHYLGKAFDMDHTDNATTVLNICKEYGASKAVNEGNHLHCVWP